MGMTEPVPTYVAAITTYVNYFLLALFGYVRELFAIIFRRSKSKTLTKKNEAPLVKGFDDFYTRRFYSRMDDCFNRPITGNPGAKINVLSRERVGKELKLTGQVQRCTNLGSYNYLGFSDQNEMCRNEVKSAMSEYGVSTTSSVLNGGQTVLHAQLEKEIAEYVGKPAAIVTAMGYATNSTTIPSLVSKGDLIVSDQLNHASIVSGARSSGAKVRVFEHNSAKSLTRVLRAAIRDGQPRTGLPWKKILVIVEGIYSMEGEICNLKEIAAVCKKHKAYLWLDEAHSIGCMGPTGRGICEHLGVSTDDVDILMGTFTKSFGGVGGYVAGSKELIDYLRASSSYMLHASTMSPACVQQCLSALKIMRGDDGTDLGQRKIKQLRENSNMFRRHMEKLGCHVLGSDDSPVIPVMLYNPTKIAGFSRMCLERNIAVVVVGFPATPLLLSRVRFCISARRHVLRGGRPLGHGHRTTVPLPHGLRWRRRQEAAYLPRSCVQPGGPRVHPDGQGDQGRRPLVRPHGEADNATDARLDARHVAVAARALPGGKGGGPLSAASRCSSATGRATVFSCGLPSTTPTLGVCKEKLMSRDTF